tara:strand:+ start:186 stop:578 length:393 start_codon:yes stop_codon:yes gene_type:complete
MKKNNFALLFKNNKSNNNQPDYTGNFEFDGKKGRVAAWIKTAKNNNKFLSVSFQDEEEIKQKTKLSPQIKEEFTQVSHLNDKEREILAAYNLRTNIKVAKQTQKSSVKVGEGKRRKEEFPKRYFKDTDKY